MKPISTCLWFDTQAEEAARFYTSVFKNSKLGRVVRYPEAATGPSGKKAGDVMTVEFELEGQPIMGLNGGPMFKPTPAFSFFVACKTEAETKELWEKLSQGGTVRMGLDKYPWSPCYGWTADRFGMEWQIIQQDHPQKIRPGFLFVENLFGKGEEAINFYMSVFPDSKIEAMSRDAEHVIHCAFQLNGQSFTLMEGPGKHGYTFSHAQSLVVPCETQAEIDRFTTQLTAGGGSLEPCGWVMDKYGVSWQITSTKLEQLMGDPNQAKVNRMTEVMFGMKKLDIAALEAAFNGA